MRPIANRVAPFELPTDSYFANIRNLFEKLEGVDELMEDPQITSVRLVTNPEKMVLRETQRAFVYFSLHGLTVDAVIVNRLLPRDVKDAWFAEWHTSQEKVLEEIEEYFAPVPVRRVPLFAHEVIGKERLEELARVLYHEGEDPAAVTRTEKPYTFGKTDGSVRDSGAAAVCGEGRSRAVQEGRRAGGRNRHAAPAYRAAAVDGGAASVAGETRQSRPHSRDEGDAMSAESTTSNAAGETAGSGRCVCQEVLDHVSKVFAVSPEVKQHLDEFARRIPESDSRGARSADREPFGEVAAGFADRSRIVRKGASPRGEAVHESGARQAAPLRAPPDLARPGASYAHSPARITGSELPAAVMPSTSILPEPIIQST